MADTQREQVLRQALTRAGLYTDGPVTGTEDQAILVANQSYDFNFDRELENFPWGFATKRDTLSPDQDLGIQGRGFRYRYEIPKQVRFLWDIYLDSPSFDVGSLSVFYRPQISLPLIQTPGHLRGVAEAVDGGIESDAECINIFFTKKGKIDEGRLSGPFIKILTDTIVLDLKEWKGSDASVLSYHNKRKKEGRTKAHGQGSIENQRIKSVEWTPLVKRLMSLR